MFVVNRKGGSWDDAYTESLFVTQDEEVAKKYCHKANEVFKRITMRFHEIDSELVDIDDESVRKNLLLEWWCKYYKLSDVNSHDYEPIEVR